MADDTVTVDTIRAEMILEVETFAAATDITHEVTAPHVAWMTAKIDALIAAVRAETPAPPAIGEYPEEDRRAVAEKLERP